MVVLEWFVTILIIYLVLIGLLIARDFLHNVNRESK